jgi:sirohydrochlorin ferrochelatase
VPLEKTGVVLVDHGSRRAQSNQLLLEVVEAYRAHSTWQIVEPAHMELAEPSIATAFTRCVQRGAERVVVFPYFLAPGRHWSSDIPALVAQAAQAHPGVDFLVTAPLGLHALILQVVEERIAHCLQHAEAGGPACELCAQDAGCAVKTAPAP